MMEPPAALPAVAASPTAPPPAPAAPPPAATVAPPLTGISCEDDRPSGLRFSLSLVYRTVYRPASGGLPSVPSEGATMTSVTTAACHCPSTLHRASTPLPLRRLTAVDVAALAEAAAAAGVRSRRVGVEPLPPRRCRLGLRPEEGRRLLSEWERFFFCFCCCCCCCCR
jgi:hypothetical protein